MPLGDLCPLRLPSYSLRMRDEPFSENLAHVLDIQLQGPSSIQKTDPQTECGICYAQYLPIAAVGPSTLFALKIGCVPSQRQGSPFYVLFGNCPYCSDPIAVKISSRK
ncbi:hypothetical protein K7X08_005156 [Anisodus acutangulus]|uniref:Uncharacterized protein n=1 Tax=Anisodus acutangulus TaxID=402998 RepID=A0A9Q1RJ65_9SOLA|nr:hypothetical protein K7X08_005156 [Anisodus acutangulus]